MKIKAVAVIIVVVLFVLLSYKKGKVDGYRQHHQKWMNQSSGLLPRLNTNPTAQMFYRYRAIMD